MISHISFVSIPVTDQDRALAFWRDAMGFQVTVDAEFMPGVRWIMLKCGDARTEIHLDKVEAITPSERPTLPLIAPDVPGAVQALRDKGVQIVAEPKPAEWNEAVTYALIRDSEGNVILLASA